MAVLYAVAEDVDFRSQIVRIKTAEISSFKLWLDREEVAAFSSGYIWRGSMRGWGEGHES